MTRAHLFTIVSATSLLLGVAAAVLWVRSYSISSTTVGDEVDLHGVEMSSVFGRLSIASRRPKPPTSHTVTTTAPDGSVTETTYVQSYAPRYYMSAPYAAVVPLTVIMPVLWLVFAIRDARRRNSSHCSTCGYDLRATPDRCPECGTPIYPKTRAEA